MVNRGLILASASPRRAQLLARLRVPFAVLPSDADETLPGGPLEAAIAEVARRKAEACACVHAPGDAIVLSADTLVRADGDILGKPGSLEEARAMVGKLSGARHEVFTGVCLLDSASGRTALFTEITEVTFMPMTPSDIAWIVAGDQPLDRAGGCDIEGCAGCFVESISGCFDNVMGLPVSRVRRRLEEEFGFVLIKAE